MLLRIHGKPAYLAHFLAVLLFCCFMPSCVCVINGKQVNGGTVMGIKKGINGNEGEENKEVK